MSFKLKLLLSVTPAIWILDQFTKWVVVQKIPFHGKIEIIPGYFDFIHILNKGAAFGIFSDAGSWRSSFFLIISILAFVFINIYYWQLSESDKMTEIALVLILGGLLGNLTDRLRIDAVIDFISVHFQEKFVDTLFFGFPLHFRLEWPAFNIADSAITVAMVLLLITILKGEANVDD